MVSAARLGDQSDVRPMSDQQIGGLLTWIPPAMMCAVNMLAILRYMLHEQGGRPSAESTQANAVNV